MHKTIHFDLINHEPKISQYFYSLEGEGLNVGEPSFYLRFAGCFSAACKFCDTKFSWFESRYKSFSEFIENEKVKEFIKNHQNVRRLTITGGEPLHFMNSFFIVVKKLKENFKNLELLGIESNGNLLSKKENAENLWNVFKKIKNIGITPMLTISPKIDAGDCYDNQLNQEDVNKIYEKAFKYVHRYLQDRFIINFKFIWGVNDSQNQLTEEYINVLINKYEISKSNIFLMPFTPEDINSQEWENSKKTTAQKALEIGVRYSPRLHIDLNLD